MGQKKPPNQPATLPHHPKRRRHLTPALHSPAPRVLTPTHLALACRCHLAVPCHEQRTSPTQICLLLAQTLTLKTGPCTAANAASSITFQYNVRAQSTSAASVRLTTRTTALTTLLPEMHLCG